MLKMEYIDSDATNEVFTDEKQYTYNRRNDLRIKWAKDLSMSKTTQEQTQEMKEVKCVSVMQCYIKQMNVVAFQSYCMCTFFEASGSLRASRL